MQIMTIPVSEDILSTVHMSKDEMAAVMSRDYAVKLFAEGRLTLANRPGYAEWTSLIFLTLWQKRGYRWRILNHRIWKKN
jgi:hypothetical protein